MTGSTAPTLAAIRGAFAELTAEVQPGDFVYLHFSGHGTQAPALDPSHGTGRAGRVVPAGGHRAVVGQVGAVENALVDDEIGALIDGLRAKGAECLGGVRFSCHSGTATRAVESAR